MNMVSAGSFSNNTSSNQGGSSLDPYMLIEALTGRKIPRRPISEEYDALDDLRPGGEGDDNGPDDRVGREPQEDQCPKDIQVGAVNPYALVENLIGRRLDRRSMSNAHIMADVLQTDYDELFDMCNNSVLYAGLRLNEKERRAERLNEGDMRIVKERDLETPDLSQVERLQDLERIGLKDMNNLRVKMAHMQNGKLCLVLNAKQLARTVSNRDVTMTLNELITPFRHEHGSDWTPPNGSWRDGFDALFQNAEEQRLVASINDFRVGQMSPHGCSPNNKFDDPVQGCSSNSWFVAALFAVFWADPNCLNRDTRAMHTRRNDGSSDERKRRLTVKFHDKGGENNNRTQMVEVDYEIPVSNSSNDPMYCRSSDRTDIWPCLYEKAFAKWITSAKSERPDITQTAHGDPIKAMAQLNGRDPHYYLCDRHSAKEMAGLVRRNTVNFKTINPMCAYTYGSGHMYRGSNMVANHAYSILGWARHGETQYIIVRNPWGVTEPKGLTSYPGLIDRVEPQFWRPACLLDTEGVLAIEMNAFKEYFACVGVAK